ncbi:MAG: DgaE family pyridoxal phosphate-dependent ammonia lyase [Angelakisella sp.]
MPTIYEKNNLRRVINASGRMTALGVSTIDNEVAKVLVEAAQNYVVIDELLDKVGELISVHTGGEDSCVTSCASAAICLSVAATIAGDDITLIEQLPNSAGLKNEIVIQKGHAVNFGADVCQMIRIGGGVPVEAGCANRVSKDHIRGCITDKTAALFYVKSHHAVQKGMVSLEDMIAIAHEKGLPIIVDAAAEEDITRYVAMGVDLTCYSGAKAFEAPTSGFVTGNKQLIAAAKKQYKGVGRPMKVGKECMMGLTKALELYTKRDNDAYLKTLENRVDSLIAGLTGLPHIKVSKSADEAGRTIYRVKVDMLPDSPITAMELVDQLKAGNPAIHTRDHYSNVGTVFFDPRPMFDTDVQLVVERMKSILAK